MSIAILSVTIKSDFPLIFLPKERKKPLDVGDIVRILLSYKYKISLL